jgi:fucose permease
MAPDTAAATVAVLYAAHLAGRVAASRIARRLPTRRLLALALLVVLAGSPLLLAATRPGLAVVGIIVAGAGTGATFPLASALHVQASHRSSDGALGQTLAVAALGELAGPLMAGVIAQIAGLRAGLLILPASAVLAALTLLPRPHRDPLRATR